MDSGSRASLPARFAAWFDRRGWRPHAHQLALLQAARDGRSALLVAPTGGGATRPCFVSDGRRLLLPAFGAYAGGLDVLDPAIAGLFPGGFQVALTGSGRVHRFPAGALRPVA